MPVKPKRKAAPRKPRASNDVPINEIALEAQRLLGWDSRITRYVPFEEDVNETELNKIMRNTDLFTVQHSTLIGHTIIEGYEVREVGALTDEKTKTLIRIVKVTKAKTEPETA